MRWPRALTRRRIAVALAIQAVAALLGLRAILADDPIGQLRVESPTRRTGSIHLPRGGRYVFGCQCQAPARLEIGGRTLSLREGRDGPQGVSIDLPAGVTAIALDSWPGTRLLWHPPGRRGDLEYLPASSLSPEPPERARFGRWAGAAPLDGVIALGLIAVVAGLALFLGWGRVVRLVRDRRPLVVGFTAVLVLALGVRLWDLGGAGQTFDEDVNWSAGRNYVTNVVSGDVSQRSWIWNHQHPPVMKYIAGVGAQLADGYGPARALSALCLALGCALLVPIGARLWSLRAGVAAGIVAALTPHLIAHGKVVGHEAPTVLWWTLGLWLCLRAFDGVGADRRADTRVLARRFAVIGVVLGLAIFSRFVNGLLAPLLGVTLLLMAPPALRVRTAALGLAILPVAALLTGVLLWPRLWSDPIGHLAQSWAKLSQTHAAEPFLGKLTATPPRWYFLAYLGATAPLGVLLGVAGFGARVAIRREWRSAAIAVALFVVPLGVMLSPVRQDGVRYVMPCLVALALMCGAGLDLVATLIARGRLAARAPAVFAAVTAAFALYLAIVCARVHPYYLDYYGEQVGGPAGVARGRSFELGWWGEGVDRAVAHVAAHAQPGDRVYRECVEALHLAWWHFDAWATLTRNPKQANWIVVQPAGRSCPIPADARLVYSVTTMGAPLVNVYQRR